MGQLSLSEDLHAVQKALFENRLPCDFIIHLVIRDELVDVLFTSHFPNIGRVCKRCRDA